MQRKVNEIKDIQNIWQLIAYGMSKHMVSLIIILSILGIFITIILTVRINIDKEGKITGGKDSVKLPMQRKK